MKCEVIRDLLLLYQEDACSAETSRLVEEHLKSCPKCRSYLESLRSADAPPTLNPEDENREEHVFRRGLKKIRRRWFALVAAFLLFFPFLGCAVLARNEYKKESVCFTNLDDISIAMDFARLLEKQDWEKAADMIDFSGDYESLQDAKRSILSSSPEEQQSFYSFYGEKLGLEQEEYCAFRTNDFVQRMQDYQSMGYTLFCEGYSDAFYYDLDGKPYWSIEIKICETVNQAKTPGRLVINIKSGSVSPSVTSIGNIFLTDEALGRVKWDGSIY